jgi:hypothetical protein
MLMLAGVVSMVQVFQQSHGQTAVLHTTVDCCLVRVASHGGAVTTTCRGIQQNSQVGS